MQVRLYLSIAVVVGLFGNVQGQEKKTASIKIVLPDRNFNPPELKVDGTKIKTVNVPDTVLKTPPLEAGKTYEYRVEVLLQPNNYTKITRFRDITFKAGEEVTVDLRVRDDKTDKIVVRWVPTPEDIVDTMCEMAKVGKNDVIYDPGCGDAVMLIRPIKKLGAKKGIGIDIDPKMVEMAKEKVKEAGLADKIEIRKGDILDEKAMKDVVDSTVVLLYIGDDLGRRISPVLQNNLKPGTRIVSHRFMLGDWKPEKSITVKGADGDEYELHLWTVKEKK